VAARRRLDADLVRRKLLPDKAAAQAAIEARSVTVNGALANKPTHMVLPGDAIEVLGPPPKYVGRGGDKLEGALGLFAIDPAGWNCVDVGFLQSDAARVVAIDVGRAQLHERLRNDDRVLVMEQTDVRSVNVSELGGPFDLVVIDVSFIGLDRILDVVNELAGPDGQILALVKPQFEAERQEASKGKGIIRDPEIWKRVLHDAVLACRRRSLRVGGVGVSPIKGGNGNVEFFLWIGGSATLVPDSVDDPAVITALEQAGALP